MKSRKFLQYHDLDIAPVVIQPVLGNTEIRQAFQQYNKKVEPVPVDRKWWHGKVMPSGNVAGVHHYHVEGWNNYEILTGYKNLGKRINTLI